jgi:imidazolonepropionase-like amidohydrolase
MSRVVFINATVLDVVAGQLLPDRHVAVEGERIAAVDSGRPTTGGDVRVIDAQGRVLMPGLCDAHVHVTAATPDLASLERWSTSYVVARSGEIMRAMLHRGFTTVRDAGGADHGLAQAVREKLLPGPRLLYCGKALSQTGGHGDMRLPGEVRLGQCPCCAGLGRICDGVPEIRRACRDEIRKGANQIKLMVSGGIASPTDRISSTQFADEEINAAVEEAAAAEIYCMAHAYTPRAIRRAVVAGVRSIEHGNLLDQETAELMRDRGAFLVPTLATYDALAREGVEAGLPAAVQGKISQVLDAGLHALELAAAAGVRLAYGSDLLGSMHRHQLSEFSIRGAVQRPIEVVRAATLYAAELFQMTGHIGVVAPGALADLLLVDGNPLDDLGVLQDPERYLKVIMQGGGIVHSA